MGSAHLRFMEHHFLHMRCTWDVIVNELLCVHITHAVFLDNLNCLYLIQR